MWYRLLAGTTLLIAIVFIPTVAQAYFPPPVSTKITGTPPDPFQIPGAGGLGEPETPEATGGPSVQTPEPSTVGLAIAGIAMIAITQIRKRRSAIQN